MTTANLPAPGAMDRRVAPVVAGLVSLALLFGAAPSQVPEIRLPFTRTGEASARTLSATRFEPNLGQFASETGFVARGSAVTAFFGSDGVELRGRAGSTELTFPKSSARVVEGIERLPSVSNYMVGDRNMWRTNVPNYAGVAYRDLYPGIDVIFRDAGDGFEYDVIVAPGASPSSFRLASRDGDLVIREGEVVFGSEGLTQSEPVAFQEVNGVIRHVDARYVERDGVLTLRTGPYDETLPLVIDPVLAFSTYLGSDGPSDSVQAVAVDGDGNAYVAGQVDAPAPLPITDDAYQKDLAGIADASISKIDRAGQLVYSTYFGGSEADGAEDIAVGDDGTAYVVGTTRSQDLPITPDAYQSVFKGEVVDCYFDCYGDAYAMRLTADGSDLVYSTFLGGESDEIGSALEVDPDGDVYLAGFTSSADFPVTSGAYDETYNEPTCFEILCDMDVFVAKLSADGTELKSATYFGGTSLDGAQGVGLDMAGNVYIAGGLLSEDLPTTPGAFQPDKNGNGDLDFSGFAASLTGDLSSLRYATYLGGKPEEQINGLHVEPDGELWVTGTGRRMPVTADALQPKRRGDDEAFITRLSVDGSSLDYSTYFGGEGPDYGHGIVVDKQGMVNVVGTTTSRELVTRRALQSKNAGREDFFFLRFQPGADRPETSTYLGGERHDIATDIAVWAESVYLVGSSASQGMPLAGSYLQRDRRHSDGVVMRIDSGATRKVAVSDVGMKPSRLSLGLGYSVGWRFSSEKSKRHRVVDMRNTELFDSGARIRGSRYYFTLPAGRFRVLDPTTKATQKISVWPSVTHGTKPGTIDVKWAHVALGDRFVFDVQARREDAPFEMWLEGTTERSGIFDDLPGIDFFRARVRNLETGAASAWSPAGALSEGG